MPPFARKRFGQHFLVDRVVLQRIAAALELDGHEPVLEIGPGRGALTEVLLPHVPRLGAVELDRDLAAELGERHSIETLRVWNADVLDLRFEDLRRALTTGETRLVVAGNLPYNISKPVAQKLVVEHAALDRAVLMFQKEVAERLTATAGTRAYGPLTVLCGEVWTVRRLFDVAPGAFRPRPRVTSTVTGWIRRANASLDPERERRLRRALAACFGRRRQTLWNNLRSVLGDAEARTLLERTGLDGTRRAETLPAAAFRALADAWPTR